MNLSDFKKKLKQILWKNTTEAVDLLDLVVKSECIHYNSLILTRARLSDYESSIILNTEDKYKLDNELNKIRLNLLTLIDELKETELDRRKIIDIYHDDITEDDVVAETDLDWMPWETWGNHLRKLVKLVEHIKGNYGYTPSAIIGLSNGGSAVADFVGSSIFKGYQVPILTLWANRWQGTFSETIKYFDNVYNNYLLKALNESSIYPQISILVIDDLVRTSKTFFQVKDHLYNKIGKDKQIELLFMPLIIVKPEYLENAFGSLPFGFRNGEFKSIDKESYFKHFYSPYKKTPWGKRIDLDIHPLKFED